MNWLQMIFLSAVYGTTQFLPVSSEGHLAFFADLLNFSMGENGPLFCAFLKAGSLTALLWMCRREFALMYVRLFRKSIGQSGKNHATRWLVLTVFGTLPVLLSLLFAAFRRNFASNTIVVGMMFAVTAALLFAAARFLGSRKTVREMTVFDALFVGLAQAFSFLPGFSRIAAVLCTAKMRGFNEDCSVRFALFLSLPALLCRFLVSLAEGFALGVSWSCIPGCCAAFVVSCLFSCSSIQLLRRISERGISSFFRYESLIFGLVTLLLSLIS